MSPEVKAQWWGIGITAAMALIAIVLSGLSLLYTRRMAIASEGLVPPPPPPVRWETEKVEGDGWKLRNLGPQTATGVRALPDDRHRWGGPYGPQEFAGATFLPGDTKLLVVDLSLARQSRPTELWLTWDGQVIPVAVRLARPAG